MPRYIFFILIISRICILHAQNAIKGKILDAKTSEPLYGVLAAVDNNNTFTDANGYFKINTKKTFPISLNINLIGYKSVVIQVADTTFLKVYLEPQQQLLNQVLVSSTRNVTDINRSSVSAEVIKPYLVESKITTNLNKLVDQLPSVNVVDNQVNIRSGSGWSYGAGSRVMLLLDGIPFLTGDAGQVQWKFLPLENIEQIEVLKGASSVLYGSSALNGIISVQTKMPTEKTQFKVNVFSGTYSAPERTSLVFSNRAQIQQGASVFYAKKFGSNHTHGISLNGYYLNDEGYRLGEYDKRFRINSRYQYSFNGKVKGKLSVGTGFMLTDGASFLLWQSYNKGYNSLNNEVTATKSLNAYLDPNITLYAGAYKIDIKNRIFTVANDVNNPNTNQDNSFNAAYSDWQVSRILSDINLQVTSGVTMQYTLGEAALFSGQHTAQNYAGYVSLDKDLFKQKVKLTGGVRYEHFSLNQKSEGKPVFRFGANYQPMPFTFLRFSAGQGYRFPSIAETFIRTSVGALNIFPNPNLQSETGSSIEFGLRQLFKVKGIKGFADIAYFDTRYERMIEFNFASWGLSDPNPFNNIGFKSVNVGTSLINGLDFGIGLEGKLNDITIQGFAGYTYSNPQIANADKVFATDSAGVEFSFRNTRSDSTTTLKYRFNHLVKADLQFVWKKWMLGFSYKYNSRMDNVDAAFIYLNPAIPDIALSRSNNNGNQLIDARIGFKVNNKFLCNLSVTNLLNTETLYRPADIGPPRLTMLSITYQVN